MLFRCFRVVFLLRLLHINLLISEIIPWITLIKSGNEICASFERKDFSDD